VFIVFYLYLYSDSNRSRENIKGFLLYGVVCSYFSGLYQTSDTSSLASLRIIFSRMTCSSLFLLSQPATFCG